MGNGAGVALGPGEDIGTNVGRGVGNEPGWHADIANMAHSQTHFFVGFMQIL